MWYMFFFSSSFYSLCLRRSYVLASRGQVACARFMHMHASVQALFCMQLPRKFAQAAITAFAEPSNLSYQ